LQNIANNLPEAFTDYKGVTKSHNLAVNVLERVEIPTQNLPSQIRGGQVW
jgi:ABC-type polar amino acid transport system ATPase subunit